MKELFVAVAIALLAFSCSSDNENEIDTQGLSQYPVDVKMNVIQFKSMPYVFFDKQNEHDPSYVIGNGGIGVLKYNGGFAAFDKCCPAEWKGKQDNLTITSFDVEKKDFTVYCYRCQSTFDGITGNSLSGHAKEKGLKLVKYTVAHNNSTGDCHITNPNYKK